VNIPLEREKSENCIFLRLSPEVTGKNENLFLLDDFFPRAVSMQEHLLATETAASTLIGKELEFNHVAWPVLLLPESLLQTGVHLSSLKLLKDLIGNDVSLIAQAYFLPPLEIDELKKENSESLAFCANSSIRSAMYASTQFEPSITSTQFWSLKPVISLFEGGQAVVFHPLCFYPLQLNPFPLADFYNPGKSHSLNVIIQSSEGLARLYPYNSLDFEEKSLGAMIFQIAQEGYEGLFAIEGRVPLISPGRSVSESVYQFFEEELKLVENLRVSLGEKLTRLAVLVGDTNSKTFLRRSLVLALLQLSVLSDPRRSLEYVQGYSRLRADFARQFDALLGGLNDPNDKVLKTYWSAWLWKQLSMHNLDFSTEKSDDIILPEDWSEWTQEKKQRYLNHVSLLYNPEYWHIVDSSIVIMLPFMVDDLPKEIGLGGEKYALHYGNMYILAARRQDSRLISKIYDRLGPEGFEELSLGFPRPEIHEKLMLLAKWGLAKSSLEHDSLNMLDLGCAAGDLYGVAHSVFGELINYVGIDIAQKMIEAARKRGIRAVKADIQKKLPGLKKEFFDLVSLSYVLHYLKRPDRVLANAFQSLKKGGVLVMAVRRPEAGWEDYWSNLLQAEGFDPNSIFTIVEEVEVGVSEDKIKSKLLVGYLLVIK